VPLGLSSPYHKVAFYVIRVTKPDSFTIDTTNWNLVPSPISNLKLIPNAVRIRPSEEISVIGKINSTLPLISELNFYDRNITSDLFISFEPERLMLHPSAIMSTNIKVKAEGDVSSNFLLLPILVTLNPKEQANGKFKLIDDIYLPNIPIENLSTESYLMVDLQEGGGQQDFENYH